MSSETGRCWTSIVAALVVLLAAGIGVAFRFGSTWALRHECSAALAVIFVVWDIQRERRLTARRTPEQIDALLKLLGSARGDLSTAELGASRQNSSDCGWRY